MRENANSSLGAVVWICIGSLIYGFATNYFIFPHDVVLGGTSGLAVILNHIFAFSSGKWSVVLNVFIIILGLLTLGKEMAVRTLLGSIMTTVAIGAFDALPHPSKAWIENSIFSTILGCLLIALASGILFYVKSSSGGTDTIALIVQKYSSLHIGRCLFLTDVIIVVLGCIWSESTIIIASILGFLIKVFGIDFVVGRINKMRIRKMINNKTRC